MSSSKDDRSLRQKLVAMLQDKASAPMEKLAARAKIAKIDKQIALDRKFAAEHGFDIRPSVDPRQPNAGWQVRNRHESDSGELRKRDYKSPPKYQRGVARDAWQNLQAEARARVRYEDEHLLHIFGKAAGDVTSAQKNRERLKEFTGIGETCHAIDNICLINSKYTKRLMFWSYGTGKYWFIVERDCVTGKTQRSKRYFSREGALFAHTSDQITWQRCEYT